MALHRHREEFVQHLEGKGRSKSTIVAYNKDIEQLISFLDELQHSGLPQDLTTGILEAYVDKLKQEGNYTLKTVSRKINSLKTFSKYLANQGLIVSDVAAPISHPEFTPQLPRVLSPLEYRALRDTARSNVRLYTMVELLLQTGIRIGELSRLKRAHVKLDNPHIYIEPFSSNPERVVDLNERAVESIAQYFEEHQHIRDAENDQLHMFQTKTGNPVLIRNIRTAINRAFRKAGIKGATVNDIRNTFIVYQLESGIDLERLAQIVGHQKPTTTEKYLELVESRPDKTSHKIEPL
ncbi:MAG: Tyrosine recombinase XerD [candidate division WS6 bacterium OLB20]|uniref:Tyrosine recombinase XerD n=1 Tax=candidate division WS6 bacterium OLB20 TaxID=1617426 RepID=A0A136LYL3_9BACT|nr:MAG: Tyrosine recombinase XerD [candidate division WS6 bacterium OLB20]